MMLSLSTGSPIVDYGYNGYYLLIRMKQYVKDGKHSVLSNALQVNLSGFLSMYAHNGTMAKHVNMAKGYLHRAIPSSKDTADENG